MPHMRRGPQIRGIPMTAVKKHPQGKVISYDYVNVDDVSIFDASDCQS